MNGLINYGELEKPIVEIETILDRFDQEEKALILKFIGQRFRDKVQKAKMKENVNATMPKFVRKMLNRKEEEEDE